MAGDGAFPAITIIYHLHRHQLYYLLFSYIWFSYAWDAFL